MKNKIIVACVVLAIVSSFVLMYFQFGKKSIEPKEQLSSVLNVYNWEDYFGTSTIADFEKEFGVKINLTTFDSEDAMLSAVQSDTTKYDVVIASDILIKEMINMKLLSQLDMTNIPNFKNIGNEFKNSFYDIIILPKIIIVIQHNPSPINIIYFLPYFLILPSVPPVFSLCLA